MDVDEDGDFYAPEEIAPANAEAEKLEESQPEVKAEEAEGLEEGEEEDEGEESDDSDIDIMLEKTDGTKPTPPSQARYNDIRNIPQRSTASDSVTKAPVAKKETPTKGDQPVSGANLPGISTSKINVDAKPLYEPAGKPITQVNIDEDLGENDKPWRRPGTDITDYFNYGFDEFTWALYASKQDSLRKEYAQDVIAQDQKKMFEQMNMMMAMGGMPGMPGMSGGAGAGAMPMEGITPEVQAMMQQMMTQGMDPSPMDPSQLFGQGGAGGAGGNQGQGSFGGQGGFGQGQNQQMGYGFDQNNMGESRNRGGFGRGRGGRRNW